MRTFSLAALAIAQVSTAQSVDNCYDRDTHGQFKFKSVTSEAVVKGPIVKRSSIYTFDNPAKKLTEASIWLNFNPGEILSGFGYWYKKEYVPGVLMDKSKAWFIYTAITSRNEDPGIMVQTSPESYHAQIYPLAIGYDLRVRLESVGFVSADKEGFFVEPAKYWADGAEEPVKSTQVVRSGKPEEIVIREGETRLARTMNPQFDIDVYGQKFKDGYTYVAGVLRTDEPEAKLKVKGLRRVFWVAGNEDASVKYFIGRRKGAGTVQIDSLGKGGKRKGTANYKVKSLERGTDTAKLWAHQALVQGNWYKGSAVLKHSLLFQVPSTQTALLAVPQEQMKLFKKKEAEYRRKQREDARKRRNWEKDRNLNWNRSSGGDPEIRIAFKNAKSVTATLPDGTVLDLKKAGGDIWGGNFEIPATAPEGEYSVVVRCYHFDGQMTEKTLSYHVDRTAPKGKFVSKTGMIVVESEPGLSQALIVFGNGKEATMVETEPGIYETPALGRVAKVLLIDKAHNIRELK